MPSPDVAVLIVGAGPSGGTLSLLLAQYGVMSIVISRHRGTANTPRAHIFNQRAMEVMRDAGLEPRLGSLASDASAMQHTSWLHSLNGEEYGRLLSWGNDPARKGLYESCSPCRMSDLPQHRLEPVLIEEAARLGVEFRFYTEFVSFVQEADIVRTTIRDRTTGAAIELTSTYLVGADGARSPILEQLGVPIDGRQLNDAFNVHIKADMARFFEHRPGSLNWILNPDAPDWSAVGNFRMVEPWKEFVVSMHPSVTDGQTTEPTEAAILKRLYQMIGEEIPIEILSAYRWTINDQVARQWQKGRVLCIGDATHRHPPINGLGSNTCISDAFNLAWKLSYVLKSWAAPSLLETLTAERKPVGDWIVKRANAGMEVHRKLWSILGLTPEARVEATATLKAATKAGQELRSSLRVTLGAVDDEVQAVGIQMNQVYLNSPATLVDAGDSGPDLSHINWLKDVIITTFPGYHLPHVWLAKDGQSERVSTLDLAGHGKFTVFTGIGGDPWVEAAKIITMRGGVEVQCFTIGFGCDYMDAYRDWYNVRGVDEDGVVLVRPDHFVAWRSRSLPSDALSVLDTALEYCVGYRS